MHGSRLPLYCHDEKGTRVGQDFAASDFNYYVSTYCKN